MHMPEISDDELDALFRQGADRYPDELNLGAWARMEQQLDEARVQALVRRRVARWFAAEIGLLAVLLLLWVGYRQFSTPPAPAATTVATNAAPAGPSAASTAGGQRRGATAVGAEPLAAASGTAAGYAADADATTAASGPVAAPAAAAASAAPPMVAPVGPGRSRRRVQLPLALNAAPSHETTTAPVTEAVAGPAATATVVAAPRRRTRLSGALLLADAHRPKPRLHAAETTAHPVTAARPQAAANGAGEPGATVVSASGTETGATGETAGAAGPAAGSTSAEEATTGGGAAASAAPSGAGPGAPVVAGALAAGSAGSVSAEDAPGTRRLSPAGAAIRPAADQKTGSVVAAEGAAARRQVAPVTGRFGADSALAAAPAHLLLDSLGQLPQLLPADSVVRRRPRPGMPSHIFITGVYAPEWSTVRNAGLARVGRSVGIQVEYLLMPRLRVSIGLLSSMKYYYARPEDYTFPWVPTRPVERVQATCRITDVPVNLRYDLLQGIRYRAFVSGGLTSLLMRDELYTYTYTGSTYTRSWQVKNGSNHPFSVVNISAGLERQLTARWSVQAEPYVKVPLGGVGAGKVRLSSGGVFFGLKYGL